MGFETFELVGKGPGRNLDFWGTQNFIGYEPKSRSKETQKQVKRNSHNLSLVWTWRCVDAVRMKSRPLALRTMWRYGANSIGGWQRR